MSATRFAELTGLSRERLRTWERRHGFPQPQRVAGGPRRYALADVARAIAVRRAVEDGVPIPAAVARTENVGRADGVADADFRAVVETWPAVAAVLSGPAPVRFEYLNAAARAAAGAPAAGDELLTAAPWLANSPLANALHALFTTTASTIECVHAGWDAERRTVRSVLSRLPVDVGERPLIAVAGLEDAREQRVRRALTELESDHERLQSRTARQARWLETIASLADVIQREAGGALLSAATDSLVRQLDAIDAVVAPYMSGDLVVGRTRRGALGPAIVPVAAFDDLGGALREGSPTWLEPRTAAAFGAAADLHLAAVPAVVAGERLGVLLLLFDERGEIGDADVRRLLSIMSAGIGYALLRDRFLAGVREAAGS